MPVEVHVPIEASDRYAFDRSAFDLKRIVADCRNVGLNGNVRVAGDRVDQRLQPAFSHLTVAVYVDENFASRFRRSLVPGSLIRVPILFS